MKRINALFLFTTKYLLWANVPNHSLSFLRFCDPWRARWLGIFALSRIKGVAKMSKLREQLVDARLLHVMAEAGLDVSSVGFEERTAEEWREFGWGLLQRLEGVRLLAVITVALGFVETPEVRVM